MSYGEKKLLAIAGVIVTEPKVLILDEPTAGLDVYSKNKLFKFLNYYHQKTNSTIFFISHMSEELAIIAQKILILHKGEIKLFDVVRNVFTNFELLKSVEIIPPLIARIMREVSKENTILDKKIITVNVAKNEILKIVKNNQKNPKT